MPLTHNLEEMPSSWYPSTDESISFARADVGKMNTKQSLDVSNLSFERLRKFEAKILNGMAINFAIYIS